MTTLEVLVKARALLVERGWTQGDYEDKLGGLCVLGAIRVACEPNTPVREQSRSRDNAAGMAVYALRGVALGGKSLAVWNDAAGRTFDEVLAALDAAIGEVRS